MRSQLLVLTGQKREAIFDLTARTLVPTWVSNEMVQTWAGLSPDGAWVAGRPYNRDGKVGCLLVENPTFRGNSEDARPGTANTETQECRQHTHTVSSVDFSRDMQLIATSSWDTTVGVWDRNVPDQGKAQSPVLMNTLQHAAAVYSSQFSTDNSHLLTVCKGGSAQVWNVETGQIAGATVTGVDDIGAQFRPETDELLTVDFEGHFDIWDWRESTKIWPTTQFFETSATIWSGNRSLVLSPDGRYAAIGGHGAMHIVDLTPLDDPRLPSPGDLTATAELFSGLRLNENGRPVRLTPNEWSARLQGQRRHSDSLETTEWFASVGDDPTQQRPDSLPEPPDPSSSASSFVHDIATAYAQSLDAAIDARDQQRIIEELRITDPVLAKLIEIRPKNEQLHLAQASRLAKRNDAAAAMSHRRTALALLEQQLPMHPDDQFLATQIAELLLETHSTAWHHLEIQQAISKLGTTLTIQKDGSVLASGEDPSGDLYSLQATTNINKIAAFRLEVLPDPSLPNEGPGRHPTGNFQLAAFRVFGTDANDPSIRVPIQISDASASYSWSDPSINVLGTIDEDDPRVWHVWGRFGEGHTAIFSLRQATTDSPDGTLLLELQHYTDGADSLNLGRFRLSVTSTSEAELQKLRKSIRDKLLSGHEVLAAVYRAIGYTAKADMLTPSAIPESK